jgi:hypothetical protein
MKSHLVTSKKKLTIDIILNRVKRKSVVFLADDQVNNQKAATSAVEVILAGLDIPVSLALEDENGKYQIVSKGKYLCAITQFILGDLSLLASHVFKEVGGKRFDELRPLLQNRIYNYEASISTCLAPASTPDEIEALIASFTALQ